jgi:predicted DNA-binding transcriptional regulator YafY
MNPYQIVAANGRYYLICNNDKYDNMSNYRLDLITDIELLESPVKPMKKVQGLENGLDLPKHMAESVYMYAGKRVLVKFRAKNYLINDIIDWFGKDVRFTDETKDDCVVTVRVSEDAMFCWALQYGPHVEVLEPVELREMLKTAVADMGEKYK